MAEQAKKEVRVHYRKAVIENHPGQVTTLQEALAKVMSGRLGEDARSRIFPVTDDGQHKGCLNFSKIGSKSFLADVMHLDGRRTLPTWIHPKEPKPVAEVVPKTLAENEASLGEPAYILVHGNHVAAIERLGFRSSNLTNYLNALLRAGGELPKGAYWKLVPHIEMTETEATGSKVSKIIVKPNIGLMGAGASRVDESEKTVRRARRSLSALDQIVVGGQRVLALLQAVGADEAKLEQLREQMSSDLILKAKLEFTVQSSRRNSTATVPTETVQQALAELSQDSTVEIVDENGRSKGKMVQLVHKAEVVETGGLLDWERTAAAMLSALTAWAAKGAIEIEL